MLEWHETSTVIGLFFRVFLRRRQSSFHWIISDGVHNTVSGIGRKWKPRAYDLANDHGHMKTVFVGSVFLKQLEVFVDL